MKFPHLLLLLLLFGITIHCLRAEQSSSSSSSDYQHTLGQQEIFGKRGESREEDQLSSLSRIAPILGESSIVDKETGRVFWQGGKQSLFHSTVGHSYLSSREGILRHIRATFLSCIIWISVIRFVTEWLLKQDFLALENVVEKVMTLSTLEKIGNIAKRVARVLLLCLAFLPTFNRSFVVITILLYLLESFSCSTRKYLSNSLSSPEQIEAYMEGLRKQEPCIKWEIRCFHHEQRKWLSRLLLVDLLNWSRLLYDPNQKPILLTKKVITNQVTEYYELNTWKDQTVAGIWKRASSTTFMVAPFTKIALSKLILFKNAKVKQDYFSQKSEFVNREGKKDEFAEFSTSIEVPGYRPKLLAVKNNYSRQAFYSKCSIEMFWLYTLLGLTVPFRLRFASQCDELRVTAVKEISKEIRKEKEETSTTFSMQSWLLSPKTWFKSPPLAENIKQKGEGFRKQMEELLLYSSNFVSSTNDVGDETKTEGNEPAAQDVHSFDHPRVNVTNIERNETVPIMDIEVVANSTASGDKI